MKEKTCNKLLKEWAIVCKALGEGRQIFVARKGGISEETEGFVVENRSFFLFPTTLHQNREEIKPEFYLDLELIGSEESQGKILLQYFAEVTATVVCQDKRSLHHLLKEHIWTNSFLESRFDYRGDGRLTLLILRVYELPQMIELPMKTSYRGCKSWVTISPPLTVPLGLRPVLSDSEFFQQSLSLIKR
ncbi:MAG: DUF1802 family protein [Deltaproteobacteria bacterium]|nr:DUF1802 family protein [Deltaproteobacteria bacterium]MBI2500984.1 DUF1802 family protein [Deltaproteobacteria bacterium]